MVQFRCAINNMVSVGQFTHVDSVVIEALIGEVGPFIRLKFRIFGGTSVFKLGFQILIVKFGTTRDLPKILNGS